MVGFAASQFFVDPAAGPACIIGGRAVLYQNGDEALGSPDSGLYSPFREERRCYAI